MSVKLPRQVAIAALLSMTLGVSAQPVQLKVFDKVGNEVGPFDHGLVYIRLVDSTLVAIQLAALAIETSRGWWSDNTRMVPVSQYERPVYFTETDCGGASYVLPWSDVPGVSPSAIVNDKNTNNVFVYVGKVGRPVVRALHSRLTFHKHCDNFYKRVEEKAVIPVVKVFDLTSQFPVPYSLR